MADSGAPPGAVSDSPPSFLEAATNESESSRVKHELHQENEEIDPDLIVTLTILRERPERIVRWEQTHRPRQNATIQNMVSDAIATKFPTPPLVRLSPEERQKLYTTPTKQSMAESGGNKPSCDSDGDQSRETNVTSFGEDDIDDDDEVRVPSAPVTPGNVRDLEEFDIESDDDIICINFFPAPTHTNITNNGGNAVKPETPIEAGETNRANQTEENNEREPSVPLTPGMQGTNFESDSEPDGLMIDEQDEPTFEPCRNNAQSQQLCGLSQTVEGEIMEVEILEAVILEAEILEAEIMEKIMEVEIIQLSPPPEPTTNNETEQQIMVGEAEILDDYVVLEQDPQPKSVPNPDQLATVEIDSTANAPRRRRRLNSTPQDRVMRKLNMGRTRSPSPVCTCVKRIMRTGENSYHARRCPCRNRRKKKAVKQEDDSEPQEVVDLSSDDSDEPMDIEDDIEELEMSPDPDVPCCSSSLRAKPLRDHSKKRITLSPVAVTHKVTYPAKSSGQPSTSRRAKRKRARYVTPQRFKKRRNIFSRTCESRKHPVEEIVGRAILSGREYFIVKWEGAKWSDPIHDAYICRSTLLRDAPELVQEYEQAHPRPIHTQEDTDLIWSLFSEEDQEMILANGIRWDFASFVQPLPEEVTMEVPRRLEGVPKVQKEKKKRVHRSEALPIRSRSMSRNIELSMSANVVVEPERVITANEIYDAVIKYINNHFRGENRYCYFLMEESQILEYLNPERIEYLSLETFKKAIFYVGKGESKRKESHLEDAVRFVKTNEDMDEPKINRILDIWNKNGKVISYEFFNSSLSPVAYIYECGMIENIGLANLTNKENRNTGHFKKYLKMDLNSAERAAFGEIMVSKAHDIFKIRYDQFKGWTREMVKRDRQLKEKEKRLKANVRNLKCGTEPSNGTELRGSTELNLSTEPIQIE
ncbi:ankyrin repeat and LEM domain-containing protein 1 [Ditylenchus destructor]|nr:ankyrin repeat and LEM domain-containing protein 1 [Ditylenchus destructor]